MKLILSLCCRVIQRPQILDKYPGAEKFLIFLQIWRSLPRRIGPKSHNRKMKNTIFFFLKLLFVSIANNFPLYHDITTVICFWSAQNTNTQCIQQCIFIKNTSYPTQTPHIKQPNGEIMQYGAVQRGSRIWNSNHTRPQTPSGRRGLLPKLLTKNTE